MKASGKGCRWFFPSLPIIGKRDSVGRGDKSGWDAEEGAIEE